MTSQPDTLARDWCVLRVRKTTRTRVRKMRDAGIGGGCATIEAVILLALDVLDESVDVPPIPLPRAKKGGKRAKR